MCAVCLSVRQSATRDSAAGACRGHSVQPLPNDFGCWHSCHKYWEPRRLRSWFMARNVYLKYSSRDINPGLFLLLQFHYFNLLVIRHLIITSGQSNVASHRTLSLAVGGSEPPSNTACLGPQESSLQVGPRPVHPSAQQSHVTDRLTYTGIIDHNSLHLMHSMSHKRE